MISYQKSFGTATTPVTREMWEAVLTSDFIRTTILQIRRLRSEGKDREADQWKRKLPALCYQATFDETTSKNGNPGAWRKQSAVRLNGLFMLDIDHMEQEPRQFWKGLLRGSDQTAFCERMGIVLVHVTSSGKGLRIVAKADPEAGNIADNQRALARRLDVICDEACKDASRLSFVPTWDDVIYSDYKTLLTYNNEEFDKKYGAEYRRGRSAATRLHDNGSPADSDLPAEAGSADDGTPGTQRVEGVEVGDGQRAGSALQLKYGGVSYEKIIDCWMDAEVPGWRERAGKEDDPVANNRHRLLLRLGSDLRYACDKKEVHKRLVQESPLGVSLRQEGGEDEVNRIADDCLSYRLYREVPRRLQAILERAGVRRLEAAGGGTDPQAGIDYDAWWKRLQPLLDESPYLREACEMLPPHHRIGGVLASGAMFGTYLTRCWWEHYDGKPMRLSFLVYIIGDAASGKSRIGDINDLIMAPMKAADEMGRNMERDYERNLRKREQSTKDAREAAREKPTPCIRIVPSSISNKILYERLTYCNDPDSVDWNGKQQVRHLYSYEPELSAALRIEGQGAWASKIDIECKAFQNEETGVDYANSREVNGIFQVAWNRIITGTPDAMRRKIRKSTVLDGLVTRLCLFVMPSNLYQMIERGKRFIDHERDCKLRSVGIDLDKISGKLDCDRLVDFAYEYEADLTRQAEMNEDRCLDYFRKRIPIIMIRYALVRAVLRQVKQLEKGEELVIEDSDLEFARLIGDFCLDMQIHLYGNDVMEALEAQDAAFKPRRRRNTTKELFDRLPKKFTIEEFKAATPDMSRSGRSNKLARWTEDGLLEKKGDKYIKKTNSTE